MVDVSAGFSLNAAYTPANRTVEAGDSWKATDAHFGPRFGLAMASPVRLFLAFFLKKLDSWSPSPERKREGVRHQKKGNEKCSNKSLHQPEQVQASLGQVVASRASPKR